MRMRIGASKKGYPKFFKVYDPQNCSETLMIPPAFEERISGKIADRVIVKNGRGKPWLVDVIKSEDALYLKRGWSKFVLDNSLEPGDFLVFKYSGQRIFEVLILAKNGCQKQLIHLSPSPPTSTTSTTS